MSLNTPEPKPKQNDGRPVWREVIADMLERDREGRKKYGTPLQTNNGRDALVDLYQELLDAVVYLKQRFIERDQDRLTLDLGLLTNDLEELAEKITRDIWDHPAIETREELKALILAAFRIRLAGYG